LVQRPQRLRRTAAIRDLVRETRLSADRLVAPLFVCEGAHARIPVQSMPGVSRFSPDLIVEEVRRLADCGVRSFLFFGVPPKEKKDAEGSEAWNPDGVLQRTLTAVKHAAPETTLFADACFCEYTDHGHCGPLTDAGLPHWEKTAANLARTAISQARAGADFIAPSGMFDGMVRTIRTALDAEGLSPTGILSYGVKYASAFYGPFREAADSSPSFGDRAAHQMDPANVRESVREALLDEEEGADLIMVKPALPCLDVIRAVREAVRVPVAAYCVSGEYAAVKAAAQNGWLDEKRAVLELTTAIARAGADVIVTYWAEALAEWLGT
jgi:porphobilinogen synthase